jgi:peptide/nickel transport system permease protein
MLPPARRRRLLRIARRPATIFGLLGLLLLLVLAVAGTHLAPYGPQALDLSNQNSPPTWQHLFGTDDLGRDLFSQVLAGARYSLTAVVVVLSLALLIGLSLGAAAGYIGGVVDEILMRITDIFFAFPTIILAMAIAASLGAGLTSCMAAITAVWWPSYARLVRGQVLAIKNFAYVDAARSLGASHQRIIAAHILRNGMAPVLVQLTLDMGGVLVTFAGLSFLGLGAPIGSPEWGALTSAGQGYLLDYWWLAIFPGMAIFIAALLLNLLGDTFQELLDPGASARL